MKNLEFKVKINKPEKYEDKLKTLHPEFLGTELQSDTYFIVPKGRLKLRESNLKNTLINYYRDENKGTKIAEVMLYPHEPNPMLKKILSEQLGIKVVVNKIRKKYSVKNAVFHFDLVSDLGNFLEVEITNEVKSYSLEQMETDLDKFLAFFELDKKQLIKTSYCELLMELKNKKKTIK
jgi:predicted adenylyl cyclase CyaB